jgi:hypothetical protein
VERTVEETPVSRERLGERWDSPAIRAAAGCCCGEAYRACGYDEGLRAEVERTRLCALTFVSCARHLAMYSAFSWLSRLLPRSRGCECRMSGESRLPALTAPLPIAAQAKCMPKGHPGTFTRDRIHRLPASTHVGPSSQRLGGCCFLAV